MTHCRVMGILLVILVAPFAAQAEAPQQSDLLLQRLQFTDTARESWHLGHSLFDRHSGPAYVFRGRPSPLPPPRIG